MVQQRIPADPDDRRNAGQRPCRLIIDGTERGGGRESALSNQRENIGCFRALMAPNIIHAGTTLNTDRIISSGENFAVHLFTARIMAN